MNWHKQYCVGWLLLCFFLFRVEATANELSSSGSIKQMLQNAQAEAKHGKHKKAIDLYLKILQYNPSQKEAHIGLGNSFLSIDHLNKALKSFHQADHLFNQDANIKLLLAIVHLKLDHFDTCESYLINALSIKPNYPKAYLVYGELYENRGQDDKAMQSYQYALILNPENTQAYIKLGLLHLKQNRYQQSLNYLQKAQDSDSTNPLPNLSLAQYHYKKNHFLLSLNYLDRLLLAKPGYKPAKILLYHVLFRLEKWNEANHILKSLLNRYPSEPKFYYYSALAKRKLLKLTQSLMVIDKAKQNKLINSSLILLQDSILIQIINEQSLYTSLKNNPFIQNKIEEQKDYWIRKGIEFLEQNLMSQSIFSFERAILLDNKDTRAKEHLAEIYRSKGHLWSYYHQVHQILEKVSDKNKTNLDNQYSLAKRAIKTLLSSRLNLSLQELETIPKVIFMGFKNNYDFNHYAYFDQILLSLFQTAFNLDKKLNIIFLDKGEQFQLEKIIQENQINFTLNASFEEVDDKINIELNLNYAKDGEKYQQIHIVHSEGDKLIYAAVEAARQLSKSLPLIGRVIKQKRRHVLVNLGKKHNYQIGDSFYVLPSKKVVNRLLQEKDLAYILSDKKKLYEYLLSVPFNTNAHSDLLSTEINELKIIEIDENIALTEIKNPNFLMPLSDKAYVIHQSK